MKRRRQTGEAMVVMMALMLIVLWISRGHMGMMGTGGGSKGDPQEATQAENAGGPASASPEVPVEAGAECDVANPTGRVTLAPQADVDLPASEHQCSKVFTSSDGMHSQTGFDLHGSVEAGADQRAATKRGKREKEGVCHG